MEISPAVVQTSPRPRRVLLPLEESRGQVPPGSLIISDVFSAGETESHGVSVAKAAWSLGFSGSIFYQQAVGEALPPLQQHGVAAGLLATPGLEKPLIARALKDYVVGPPLHMLMSAVDEVERASKSEAGNCVLNLSSGICKAQVAHSLYSSASSAWKSADAQEAGEGAAALDNLARLFSLDYDKLMSSNSDIARTERHRLQQSIVDGVSKIWDSEPQIPRQRERFAESVRTFESRNSSVVIAAGNEGLLRPTMELETRLQLEVPSDFEQNVLENETVTSVGASIILDGTESSARYSSSYPGIDFYTSGDAAPGLEFEESQGLSRSGTSLAAPRIGALMAKLHQDRPSASSDEVQRLLQAQLTDGGSALIDTATAQQFLLTDS